MDDHSRERELLAEAFERVVDDTFLDPDLSAEVTGVDVVERGTMTGDGTRTVFVLRVETTNRAQLLGQVAPFEAGDFAGYFPNLYRGRLVETLEREVGPAYDYSLAFDVRPTGSAGSEASTDRHLTLDEAVEAGVVPDDSRLARTMREYDLTGLVLAGGTVVTGPLASGVETMERVHERHDIDSVFDAFAGSGAYSKVALANGATHVECLDLDLTTARRNLPADEVTFHERDAFEFTPDREYDLVVTDPYYAVAAAFMDRQLDAYADAADRLFMTTAFRGHDYWHERQLDRLADRFESVEVFDTGRLYQVLAT